MADKWLPLGEALEQAFGLPPHRLSEALIGPSAFAGITAAVDSAAQLADGHEEEGGAIIRRALDEADQHGAIGLRAWTAALLEQAEALRRRREKAAAKGDAASSTGPDANAIALIGFDTLDRVLREAAAEGTLRFRGIPAEGHALVVGQPVAGIGPARQIIPATYFEGEVGFDGSSDTIDSLSVASPGFSEESLLAEDGPAQRCSFMTVEAEMPLLLAFVSRLLGPSGARPTGRPRKDSAAALDAYKRLYPNGHENARTAGGVQVTLKMARRAVEREMRISDPNASIRETWFRDIVRLAAKEEPGDG